MIVYSKAQISDSDLIQKLPESDQELWELIVTRGLKQSEIAKAQKCTRANISKKVKRLNERMEILRKLPQINLERELRNVMSKRDRAVSEHYINTLNIPKTAVACGVKENTAKRIINNLTSQLVPANVRKYVTMMQDNAQLLGKGR